MNQEQFRGKNAELVQQFRTPEAEIMRVLNNHHDLIEELQTHIIELKAEIKEMRDLK